MGASPLQPRILKGAIVVVDATTGQQTTIPFQYNPETLSRTLTPKQNINRETESGRSSLRFDGAPTEVFTLDVNLDATDALNAGDVTAQNLGIYPQLSALEVLVYPASQQVIANDKLIGQGKIELTSGYDAPLTLLVWGAQRVVPVVITSLSVTETLFDTQLNPIQATVKLSLRALTYSDLDPKHKGYSLFMAYQKSKERQAKNGAASGNTRDLLGVDIAARLR